MLSRSLTMLGLSLVASIGFAGSATAQQSTQYAPGIYPTNPSTYQPNPGTYQRTTNTYQSYPNAQGSYQGGQGAHEGSHGGYQSTQGYQGNTGQANQTTCPYGQQFDPHQNRCAYSSTGGVTVPGSIVR